MTHLSNGTAVTDLDDTETNTALLAHGYAIRHIETYPGHGSCIIWNAAEITEADLPF